MQINGVEAIRLTVELESTRKKLGILIWSVVHLLLVAVLAAIYLVWMANVNEI